MYSNSSRTYMNIVATKVEEYKVATEWGVVGDHNNWGATPDITMWTADNNLMFAKGVELQAGKKFKIRANNEWNDAKNWGMSTPQIVYSNMKLPVIVGAGSQDMTVLEDGTYDIYFDLEHELVYLMEAGKSIDTAADYERYEVPQYHNREWRLVGAFNNWNPNDDNYLMNLTEDNKWAVITTEFAADTELKFTANGGWDFNFGNGVTVELGVEYPGYQSGQNIKVPAGAYKISLSMCDGRFKFEIPVVEVTQDISFANKAQRTTFNTTKQVWEQNGITVTNDKASSSNNVADYANPARFYQNSKLTITSGGDIVKIVFDCNSTSYATALKNSLGTALGTVTVSSDKVTLELNEPTDAVVIAKFTAQVRMDKMTVTWLE